MPVICAQNLAGMQQKYPGADAGKFLHDLKPFHHRLVHQRTLQQVVQLRNVQAPSSSAKSDVLGVSFGLI